MSLAIVYSRASMGVQAPLVTIEVHLSNGKPSFTLVGLPEKTVKEAQDRVRSALLNAEFKYPAKRITVNLAPADLPKEGGRFDLPIAIGMIAAFGYIDPEKLKQFEFIGELALTGQLRAYQMFLSHIVFKRSRTHTFCKWRHLINNYLVAPTPTTSS